ncbi:MAG: hypothetical protein AABZ12_13360 [Planctomycetota bacterium]
MILLGGWQIASITWNGRDSTMKGYSALESMVMCGAVVTAALLGSGLTDHQRRRFARLVTLLLGGIVAVYVMLSFVFPSWRPSAAWANLITPALGFIRVYGPLGSSTTLNLVLVPALAVSLGGIFARGSLKPWWAMAATLFLLAILATGSRGALLCLAGFSFALMIALRIRSLAIVVPCVTLFSTIILIVGVPDRFRSFEDQSRATSYATAWRSFTASPSALLIGQGHGAIYSRLHDESMRQELGQHRWYLISDTTEFGETLRSSHTALLRTLAETGAVGGLLLYGTLGWIVLHLLRGGAPRRREYVLEGKVLLAGCVGVIPYMAFDEFFVGTPWLVMLWSLFVVLGTEMVGTRVGAKR